MPNFGLFYRYVCMCVCIAPSCIYICKEIYRLELIELPTDSLSNAIRLVPPRLLEFSVLIDRVRFQQQSIYQRSLGKTRLHYRFLLK